ncbi:hypothetical protein [Bacillus tuaregi]|uniref:hypothetical protein n=1 Tax=Bacillus tuaregi TaxID=1816695 RepID=UPI0008F832B6|nr:hypothetical protein [Bacillus tuaregi]
MKKYLLISGIILGIVLIAFSVAQWNSKVETTTEKAKKDIKVAEEKRIEKRENVDASENAEGTGSQTNGTNHSATGTHSENDPDRAQSDGSVIDDSTGNEEAGSEDTTGSSRYKGTSLEEIKGNYRKIFSDLEVQETSRVDQLVVKAKADYVSGKLSKADLAVKYQDAAMTLEQNADKMFNTIYNQLLVDLEKYGHDTNEAAEFKTEYQTKKAQRLAHIISELEDF